MMQLKQVDVVLEEKLVLQSVNLNWDKGQTLALIGANGAGKSTLLKVLAGLINPESGTVLLPSGMSMKEWRRYLGTVFQDTFLYNAMTPMENLEFYAQLYDVKNKTGIADLLKKVGLYRVRNERVSIFSKGMKQRLSIARALVHQPQYLLLDEPFDGLDVESVEQVMQLLNNLKQHGVGWLLVSHHMEQAWECCEEAIVLHRGQIRSRTACTDSTYTDFLGKYREMLKEQRHAIV
jgi:heme exporter protein A